MWRLRRQSRIAEAHAHERDDGLLEVEVIIDDLPRWSCVYSDGVDAQAALTYQRGSLEITGWREAGAHHRDTVDPSFSSVHVDPMTSRRDR